MFIRCKQIAGDNRYFVPVTINSFSLYLPFDITFLIDTGACKTQLNWNDAQSTGLFSNVRSRFLIHKDGIYTGLGGKVDATKIPAIKIIFDSSIGKHIEELDWLSISGRFAIDGKERKELPPPSSILGIDILKRFDILIEDKYAYLRKK